MTRLKRIMLLARCLLRGLVYGPANRLSSKIDRIIVIPTGKLGDVVCVTPVLFAIRNQWPRAHLIVAGNARLYQAILADSGLADEYLDLSGTNALDRLKVTKADVAIVTGPTFEETALLYLAGVPLITAPRVVGGISPLETRPYKLLTHLVEIFPYQMREYAPRERLRSLEPLGLIFDNTQKHLGYSLGAKEKVKQYLLANGINPATDFVVGITPTAGHKIKEWPVERFADVADFLIEKYQARIILIGGPRDGEKVEITKKNMKLGTQAKVVIDFTIDDLKALVSTLNLFISVDTGPIYIAEAFNIPTIDITGPIDENEQPPRGRLHRNVVPIVRKDPELFVLKAKSYNKEEALRQVLSISADQVKKEVDILMEYLNKRS